MDSYNRHFSLYVCFSNLKVASSFIIYLTSRFIFYCCITFAEFKISRWSANNIIILLQALFSLCIHIYTLCKKNTKFYCGQHIAAHLTEAEGVRQSCRIIKFFSSMRTICSCIFTFSYCPTHVPPHPEVPHSHLTMPYPMLWQRMAEYKLHNGFSIFLLCVCVLLISMDAPFYMGTNSSIYILWSLISQGFSLWLLQCMEGILYALKALSSTY